MGCWCVKDRQTSPAQYVNTRCCFQVLMTPAAASLHGCQWICLSPNKSPASFGWLFLLTGKCFQEYLCSVIVFQCHQYPTYWRRKWHNNSPEPANSVVKSRQWCVNDFCLCCGKWNISLIPSFPMAKFFFYHFKVILAVFKFLILKNTSCRAFVFSWFLLFLSLQGFWCHKLMVDNFISCGS